MIQRVVERLAGNSAQIKNWTIAVLAALLLFSHSSTEGADQIYVGTAMLILTLVFWCLDGYYLNQERLFRHLYDKVRQLDPDQVDYSMDTSKFQQRSLRSCVRRLSSVSLGPFYSTLMMLCIVNLLMS